MGAACAKLALRIRQRPINRDIRKCGVLKALLRGIVPTSRDTVSRWNIKKSSAIGPKSHQTALPGHFWFRREMGSQRVAALLNDR
jgi:hypothetical protein